MDLDDKTLMDTTNQLSRSLLGRPEGERLSDNFRSYLKLFHEVDSLAVRIQRMKAAIARETREQISMQEHIRELEKATGLQRADTPPSIEKLEWLAQSARQKTYAPITHGQEKLSFARNFLEISKEHPLNPRPQSPEKEDTL